METCKTQNSLHSLLARWDAEYDRALVPDAEVRSVTCDSRKAGPGCVFVAIEGGSSDGHAFAAKALEAGAVAVVTERSGFLPGKPVVRVKNARAAYAGLNQLLWGEPSSRLKTLAVTGTNGKTTTAFLVAHLLKRKMRPILLGTIRYAFEDTVLPSTHTTPDPDVLQPWLAQMAAKGADSVVLEASSHALEQDRLTGMTFDGALFTNLTQDHLDYHGNLENYLQAKLRLFGMLRPGGLAVVNADDAAAKRVLAAVRGRALTFGIVSEADLRAVDIRADLKGSEFRLRFEGRDHVVRTQLLGTHNIYNLLGALGLALAAGMSLDEAVPAIANFKGVPGRLERVPSDQGFELFIDYAHTPDGIENVLSAVRPYVQKRLLVLFGCGGDRDRTKRPKMAKAVERYADGVVVTSDNPRSENPREIIREIQSGFSAGYTKAQVQPDRARAIRQILLEARPGDVVLLLGKGHEEVQIIGNEKIPFSDREEALKALGGR
jgi:UDP-N-acetylmuramoyl-L-alanyl-D-glutamate--2,6-diaminopimelate ligase